jgi:hypothetical protein
MDASMWSAFHKSPATQALPTLVQVPAVLTITTMRGFVRLLWRWNDKCCHVQIRFNSVKLEL